MPLFHVQDPDRPMWVVAADYGEAERRWQQRIVEENDGEESEDRPQEIKLVCEDDELIQEPLPHPNPSPNPPQYFPMPNITILPVQPL